MELEKLFHMQKGLDEYILKNHNIEKENLFDQKVLALLVELGELANETRCFKYWSLKPPSNREVILEEFVDGIHFILSLGLTVGITMKEVKIHNEVNRSVTEQFLKVFQGVEHFRETKSEDVYVQLFSDYLSLATLLGFHEDEIKEAYISKNEVNYRRQQEGY